MTYDAILVDRNLPDGDGNHTVAKARERVSIKATRS
jgi:DNA-binding response OmpR family regulator